MLRFLRGWWAQTKELWWPPKPSDAVWRRVRAMEDIEEEKLASMDMHFGDEPLYYSDPPQWPYTPWTP